MRANGEWTAIEASAQWADWRARVARARADLAVEWATEAAGWASEYERLAEEAAVAARGADEELSASEEFMKRAAEWSTRNNALLGRVTPAVDVVTYLEGPEQ